MKIQVASKKDGVVRLNNAATTPPFPEVVEKVQEFLHNYGAVHRGAGPYAEQTLGEYESAKKKIMRFIETSPDHELLFTSNTTSAINQLTHMLNLTESDTVLTSGIEHTSNCLPWRFNTKARIATFKTNSDGSFDLDDMYGKIEALQPAIVSITGCHSLTGYIPQLREIAKKTHKSGGKLFVDCAQLAPHKPLKLKQNEVDYAAFSAHKMYAPFGIGVLVLRKELLNSQPADPGGGTIDMLADSVIWAKGTKKHQAGTLNVVGVIALAESMKVMQRIGWNKIISHEKKLTKALVEEINATAKVRTYVAPEKYEENRTGALAFNVNGLHHALVSACLDKEYNIETRSGTICSHRLVRRWLEVSEREQARIESEISKGNLLASYGIVRASIGIHNTVEDIEKLNTAVQSISAKGPQLHYSPMPSEETYKKA